MVSGFEADLACFEPPAEAAAVVVAVVAVAVAAAVVVAAVAVAASAFDAVASSPDFVAWGSDLPP